ncbi:FAD-dependent oxidoreductase, partial [Streptomyces sp. NPDC059083]|uniref:FAD-dependent oxidoreductase n=1 Tax=Streptomyces sp. NPDC059083 TaxID=3346721 RepID=UPI0036899574
GSAGDHPPADLDGLLNFVRDLDYPDPTDALADVTPLGDVHTWRSTPNRLRHFEELDRLPAGFVCVGDAVAAFNPVYGQGMTVAILGACALDDALSAWRAEHNDPADLAGFGEQFHRRLFAAIQVPWTMAISSDYRVDGVKAPPRPPEATRLTAYFDRIEALAAHDQDVLLAYLETTHLLRDPDWMTSPEIHDRIIADWDRLGERVGSVDPVPMAWTAG